MGIVVFQAIIAAGTIASLVLAILGFFNKPNQFEIAKNKAVAKYGKSFRADKEAFFEVYLKQLILSIVAVLLGVTFALIAIFVHPPGIVPTPTPTPHETITPAKDTPAIPVGLKEIKLDDYDVLRIEPEEAFFFQRWDDLNPIKVKEREYEHSIGVRVPTEVKRQLIDDHKNVRKNYDAFIEYSLAYQFDSFQFQYGIDDNTFIDYGLCPTECHYWIVVESCLSEADTYHKPIELYRTSEVNYMDSLSISEPIDVSNVETLRITVYWVFDVINSNPLPFDIAIVNPTLYY